MTVGRGSLGPIMKLHQLLQHAFTARRHCLLKRAMVISIDGRTFISSLNVLVSDSSVELLLALSLVLSSSTFLSEFLKLNDHGAEDPRLSRMRC